MEKEVEMTEHDQNLLFADVRRLSNSDLAEHKHLIALLEALTAVITGRRHRFNKCRSRRAPNGTIIFWSSNVIPYREKKSTQGDVNFGTILIISRFRKVAEYRELQQAKST